MRVNKAMALAALTLFASAAHGATIEARAASSGPPSPESTVRLSDGAVLHLASLPLGVMPAAIVGSASFESGGSRAVFVARFAGAALYGDPASMNPSQAFLLDLRNRRLTQLTSDGLAASARFTGPGTIAILDGGIDEVIRLSGMPGALGNSLAARRFSADQSLEGGLDDVTPSDSSRLRVFRRPDGTYVVRQTGARRRVEGVAPGGAFALVGDGVAWIDATARHASPVERAGVLNETPPRFDDAFGRSLSPVVPLGRPVYQGAYRDGVTYFVFSYGLTRIVAATNDFQNYFYPPRPDDPAYSVGDGFGAFSDGSLYFAWPEGLELTVQRAGRFVTLPMTFPAGYSDVQPLIASYSSLRRSGGAWPALEPDSDALDAALLQWRVYALGAGARTHWIASYLGRIYRGDESARFARIAGPVFPFAILGRTDDGMLWGASPSACESAGNACPSVLWSSRDGSNWRVRYSLDGSPGAVGGRATGLWAAETREIDGVPMICLAPLAGDANVSGFATGATYAGEQIFIASLHGADYLIWGATPGRAAGGQGALSAFRIDPALLAEKDSDGLNAFMRVRLTGSAPQGFNGLGDAAMLDPTVAELQGAQRDGGGAVLATDIAGLKPPPNLIVRTLADESRWESEFGERPEPLGIVSAQPAGAAALVTRTIWRAPLRGNGATELWRRDSNGAWSWERTLRSWVL